MVAVRLFSLAIFLMVKTKEPRGQARKIWCGAGC
jgi:hypothetical protein